MGVRPRRRSSGGRRDSITISHEAREFLQAGPIDASLLAGARNAIRECLGLTARETLVLLCDGPSAAVASALLREAEDAGVVVTPFILDAAHADNEAFIARLAARLAEADASVLVAGAAALPAEFVRSVIPAAGDARRHGHMIGVTDAVVRQSMRADYGEVDRFGERVLERVSRARTVQVTGATGTELTIRLGGAHRWCLERGRLRGGGWTHLPAGEVFTTPDDLRGTLVPDGGLWASDGNELTWARAGRVRLALDEGRLVGDRGLGAVAAEHLGAIVDVADAERRVGRIGFGTNASLLTVVGALEQDRKAPGFVLAFGCAMAERTGASWSSTVEVAALVRRPDVVVDGEPLLVRGRYARGLV